MAYSGSDGLYTVFPLPPALGSKRGGKRSRTSRATTIARKPKTRRSSRSSKKAKKGPSVGSLRTMFKGATAAPKPPKKIKIPRALAKGAEMAGGNAAVLLAQQSGREALKAAWRQAVGAVRSVPLKSAAGFLWPAAVGLASYSITKYFLDRQAEKKRNREEQAAMLADAYRQLRKDAADAAGRALTKTELDALAKAFKQQVEANGLTDFFWKG